MARVDGSGPALIVAEGNPSIPGPTAVPMIRVTAPQKLLSWSFGSLTWGWSSAEMEVVF